jgi:hypothetical protein
MFLRYISLYNSATNMIQANNNNTPQLRTDDMKQNTNTRQCPLVSIEHRSLDDYSNAESMLSKH